MAVIGSIQAKLIADASGLDSGLRLGASKISVFEKNFAGSLSRIDKRFAKVSSMIGGQALAVAGKTAAMIAPLLSAGVAINGTRAALEKFGQVADDSAAAALDPEAFQALAHQAELGGVAYETFAGALATFAKNSGLAVVGKGKMIGALKALNPELLKSIQLAGSQDERVRLVADALSKEADASKRAAIATAAFGESGLKLATVFSGGAAEIDAMAVKAKSLGIVVSRDLIERADTLGDEFDTVSKVVDVNLKAALVNLAPAMVGLIGLAGDLARSFNIVADSFQSIENRNFIRPLQNELANLYNARSALSDEITRLQQEIQSGAPNTQILKLDLSDKTAQFEAMTAQASALLDRITELQGRGSKPLELPVITEFDLPENVATRNEAAEAAVKQAEAVKELISDLQFERDMIGKTATEQRVANELRKAGVTATAEQQAQIVSLVQTIESEGAALETLKSQFETAEGYAKSFASSLISDLLRGESVADSLSNAFANLAEQLLQMAANQAISALFGNLFGAVTGGIGSGGFSGAGLGGSYGFGTYKDGGATGPHASTLPGVRL